MYMQLSGVGTRTHSQLRDPGTLPVRLALPFHKKLSYLAHLWLLLTTRGTTTVCLGILNHHLKEKEKKGKKEKYFYTCTQLFT